MLMIFYILQCIVFSFENLDVYSDVLQDEFLEIYTQSPNITQELFLKARQGFPRARLFLNERNVINSSLHTTVSV